MGQTYCLGPSGWALGPVRQAPTMGCSIEQRCHRRLAGVASPERKLTEMCVCVCVCCQVMLMVTSAEQSPPQEAAGQRKCVRARVPACTCGRVRCRQMSGAPQAIGDEHPPASQRGFQ